MKLLKPGKAQTPWSQVEVCPDCAAELEIEEGDLDAKDVGKYGMAEIRVTVTCISCGAKIVILFLTLPAYLRRRMQERASQSTWAKPRVLKWEAKL